MDSIVWKLLPRWQHLIQWELLLPQDSSQATGGEFGTAVGHQGQQPDDPEKGSLREQASEFRMDQEVDHVCRDNADPAGKY